MERVYLSGYLEGLLNMSSSLSSYIGPSYIKVDCYDKKDFEKEFCKCYDIKKIKLIETQDSLESTLLNWLNEKKIVESIVYWFDIKLKGNKKIYLPEDELISILDEKQKDFYSLDDLFFVECRKYIFVFLLGNNE